MGIRRATSSGPLLALVMRVGKSFESTSGIDKLMCVMNQMSTNLKGKLGSFLRIDTKSLKRF